MHAMWPSPVDVQPSPDVLLALYAGPQLEEDNDNFNWDSLKQMVDDRSASVRVGGKYLLLRPVGREHVWDNSQPVARNQ